MTKEDGCGNCCYFGEGTCECEDSDDFEMEVDEEHICAEHEPYDIIGD